MGVVGRAGGVGATGVTGVGGMLESLRLSWLCSAGLQPRPFPTLSLLLAFWEGTGMAGEAGRPRTQHHPNHPGQGPSEVTHHLGWGLGLLLKGFPGFGSSGLGLMDPLCMSKTWKSSWGSSRLEQLEQPPAQSHKAHQTPPHSGHGAGRSRAFGQCRT